MENTTYQVLLYYKYVAIEDPEEEMEKQRELCSSLGLKGRIIIASEGINGTLEGRNEDTEQYIREMEKSRYFSGISYKKSTGTGNSFPRLSVRVRSEIVTTGIPGLNPVSVTGKYLTAEELHQWFLDKKEFYIVDMRNDYEYASGYFENFIPSGMKNFFDLKDVSERLLHLRDKTIVTVCTGGIRCEKASGMLVLNGFPDVYQLKDGIQTYVEKYPNEHFKGKLYVFDNRVTLGFNTQDPKHEIVGKCLHCSRPEDSYVNCELNVCHKHYIACSSCIDQETGFYFCQTACKEIYQKSLNKGKKALHSLTAG